MTPEEKLLALIQQEKSPTASVTEQPKVISTVEPTHVHPTSPAPADDGVELKKAEKKLKLARDSVDRPAQPAMPRIASQAGAVGEKHAGDTASTYISPSVTAPLPGRPATG